MAFGIRKLPFSEPIDKSIVKQNMNQTKQKYIICVYLKLKYFPREIWKSGITGYFDCYAHRLEAS